VIQVKYIVLEKKFNKGPLEYAAAEGKCEFLLTLQQEIDESTQQK
jgi:hypothetical protein